MEHFKVFDADNRQRVLAFEVLAVMALFCNGILTEKLEFIHRLFDFGGHGWMGKVRKANPYPLCVGA